MYFETVVNDVVKDIKESGVGYAFFMDQVNEIIKRLNKIGIKVKYKDSKGIYTIKIDNK